MAYVSQYIQRNVRKNGAEAVLSSVAESRRNLLEQRFRALRGFEALPSIDSERSIAAEHARAMISSGIWKSSTGGLLSNAVA